MMGDDAHAVADLGRAHGRRLTASRATESAPHDTPHDAARESAERMTMRMQ
jgi:hypothetical protein